MITCFHNRGTMKSAIFALSLFTVLYCALSDDKYDYQRNDNQQVQANGYHIVEDAEPDADITPQSLPTTPASTIRMRRSPPRFDPNKMKGKYSKRLREKRDIDIGDVFRQIKDRITGRKKRFVLEDVDDGLSTKEVDQTTEAYSTQ